ncbi:MAG: tetratricopeptide repeat protein [Cyanobacteria bacterium SZAS LIN-5]|nr:tetratricopeptide repeat protein [Cyanobacteria bacterium SZAS LIN-5]
MSKIDPNTQPTASADGEITLPFSVGTLLAVAPLMVLGLIMLCIYFSGAIQMLLAERELNDYEHKSRALKYLDWALSVNPSLARAYGKRAQLRLELEQDKGPRADFSAARGDIERALKLIPDDFFFTSTNLDIDHASHDYKKEIADCSNLIQANPNINSNYEQRANAYYITGDTYNERMDRQTLIDRASEDEIDFAARGKQLIFEGRFDEAMRDYESALQKDPSQGNVYDKLARLYENSNLPSDAVATYTKIIEMARRNPDDYQFDADSAHFRRANLYLKLGNYEKALADADALVEYDKDCPHRRAFRAKILDTIGRHSAATADRKLAMERVNSDINRLPNNQDADSKAEAYVFRAGYYEAEEQWSKALSDYKIALSVKPDANSYNNCAKMYTRLGNYDQAIEYFSKAITAQPDNDDLETAYNGMAEAHLAQHKPQLAIEDCTKCIKLGLENAEASHLRARAHRELGHDREAQFDDNEAKGLEFSPLPDIG